MIKYIKSLKVLIAIKKLRENEKNLSNKNRMKQLRLDRGQGKKHIKSLDQDEVKLPNVPKILRRKWIQNKRSISRFIDDLDYNNQIQSSYDLTLLERQNKISQRDAA